MKYIKKLFSYILNFVFYFIKVKDKDIIFLSSRNRVDGNPRAIYLYLKEHYEGKFRLKYIVNKETDISDLDKNDVCYYKTLKGYYYLARCKYWILSDSVKTLLNKKKNQVYIQTFHGHGPVKREGFEIKQFQSGPEFENGIMNHARDWDIYISMSEKDDEHIKSATGFNKKVCRIGVASTDKIVKSNKMTVNEKNKLKEKYNIPLNKKIILYAPTYRENLLDKENINIPIDMLKNLEDYIILVRLHPLLNSKINKAIFNNSNFINACNVSDIVDLYPIVDILISDYSATIYEYALTGKKIIAYPYDYEDYEEFPGYIIEYDKTMPGPICYNEEDLYNIIKNEEKSFKNYDKKIKSFNEKFNYMNDGNATKRFVDMLINGDFINNSK